MRRAALLVSALVVLGCSSDNSDPLTLPITDTNVVGNYALTSSNGRSLPYTVLLTADEQWVITSDQFVTLVQICAAVQNDRLPFLPGVPTATPPLATQATLDQLLANCGQR